MKFPALRLACVAAVVAALSPLSSAAEASAKEELQALVLKVKGKINQRQATAAGLQPELAEFDRLLAAHQGEKTDDVAQILYMKATLYAQVLKDTAKATALLNQLKADFPGTRPASQADSVIASMQHQAEANKIQDALAVGSKFPEFAEKDVAGRTVSLADYRGKVVLLDFWATWCGPCVAELPNVLKAYQKHHDKGFEIIGISLDRADARDKLMAFTKEHDMPWAQIYDGGYWKSKLAVKHGVNSIPATYLLDREGNIVAKNLRGLALEKEVARLVGAK